MFCVTLPKTSIYTIMRIVLIRYMVDIPIIQYRNMKLKKRKVKYAALFFLCWFAFLVILVDGILKFQTLVDYFGSYMLVEVTLLLLVILPTWAVYKFTKEE